MQLVNTVGKRFTTATGTTFIVVADDPYPDERVTKQYRRILSLPLGCLGAISYRGTLISNIRVKGGVVRLIQIIVGGKVLDGSKAISESLGVTQAYVAYQLTPTDA